ncbi:hypothetical protein CK203_028711 [Vitis vinifera]|uniref:Uncharacterized protein n=1 Tax=Vitis vinifera TaxID=29760 RepID=A0A438IFB0_VITVI|nr:hypothetical protein CK203_028711 [Vitis vinifera]
MLIEKPNPPFKPSNGRLQKDVGDTAKPSSVLNYEKLEKTKDMESKDHKGDNKGAIMRLSPASKKHDPQGNSNTMATHHHREENTYTKIMIMVGARGVEENGVDNGSYIAVHE